MSGWVKLHRSLKDWEWYDDANATRLLIHLLLTVNYEPKKWKGITVEAGTRITSFGKLADETGLSVKQIRGAMQKLENSGEVARERAHEGQAVSLCKWEKLQSDKPKRASKRALGGQAKGKQRATTKEGKEIEEVKEVNNEVDSVGSSNEQPQPPKKKRTIFKPPELSEVQTYCQERGKGINAQQWHDHYTANGWMVGKNKMKDWKAAVRTWERNNINNGNNGTGQNTGRGAQITNIGRQDYDDM
jgi:hypothetical protein